MIWWGVSWGVPKSLDNLLFEWPHMVFEKFQKKA